MEHFFSFSSKLSSVVVQAKAVGLSNIKDSKGLFPQHRLIKGDYQEIFFPVVYRQISGKRLDDILDMGWPSLYLLSNKVVDFLEKSGLTGWSIYKINLLDKYEKTIDGYFGLSILGRSGTLIYSPENIIEKSIIPNGPISSYYNGLVIDSTTWDGADFFLAENNFTIIISSKAAGAVKKEKLTNIVLTNLKDITPPVSSIKIR